MLDTVKVTSPYVTEAVARAVELLCERRFCVELATGEVLWEFTKGDLDGSYDHRLQLRVKREEWLVLPGQRVPQCVPCQPYIELEGSLHKAILGHNIAGGPCDLAPAVRWVVDQLAAAAGVELPDGQRWRLRRVDWAECYDLGSFEAVQEFIGYFRNATFARRKVSWYAQDSLSIPGTTSTVKMYHKGPEFQRHDRPRLRRVDGMDVDALQKLANNVLRCEVEIHARTLDDEYSIAPGPAVGLPQIVQWIQSLHDRDMARVLREGASAVQIVRTAAAVRRRLYETYSARRAAALWGTWLELSAMGEGSARERLPRTTFYRHRQELEAAGCSWHGGDVKLEQRVRLVPADFTPQRHDPRRLVVEDPHVSAVLAPYRPIAAAS